jgi:hypothetical protein
LDFIDLLLEGYNYLRVNIAPAAPPALFALIPKEIT